MTHTTFFFSQQGLVREGGHPDDHEGQEEACQQVERHELKQEGIRDDHHVYEGQDGKNGHDKPRLYLVAVQLAHDMQDGVQTSVQRMLMNTMTTIIAA